MHRWEQRLEKYYYLIETLKDTQKVEDEEESVDET